MKNLNVDVVYTWDDEKGIKHETKADLGGDWNQYGGITEDLSEIQSLTEKLNEAVNEYIIDNCDEDEEDEE